MNAVILAGGFGSRLKPLTENRPKPMVGVANTPMLDYTVSHLADFGVRDLVFTLGVMPDRITEWANGYRDIRCAFSLESIPLGTAGGVKEAEKLLDDTFLVMSGDALEDIDLAALCHKHFSSGADVTMAVTRVDNPSLYGVVKADGFGTVTAFCEKPEQGAYDAALVNCGVYVVEKRVLGRIPKSEKFDFARDLFPILLADGKIAAYIHDGYWSDIGDVRSYFAANFRMLEGGFFPQIYNRSRAAYTSRLRGNRYPSLVSDSASLVGECRGSIVGHGARVASGSSVDRCIVLDEAVVKGRYIDAVIGDGWSIPVPETGTDLYRHNSTQIFQDFSQNRAF